MDQHTSTASTVSPSAAGHGTLESHGGWVHDHRLPHLLRSEHYTDPRHYEREIDRLFKPAWHVVATTDDLPRHGDFRTLELLGIPLLLRNEGGEMRAFLNACAHRHALLTHERCGSSAQLRCQYHGWEYDGDGRVCKVPDAECFEPVRHAQERLHRFRSGTCGKLVFVTLSEDAPTLEVFLGERTWARFCDFFSPHMTQVDAWEAEHSANWKVPVENSLESYHIPMVHQRTFRFLPDKSLVTHTLADGFTSYEEHNRNPSRSLRYTGQFLRQNPRYSYIHHHTFPSLTTGSSTFVSFLQAISPTSPTTSRSVCRIFFSYGDDRRLRQRLFGRFYILPKILRLLHGVFAEDSGLFADIQKGIEASHAPGVIGTREERIWVFQKYVLDGCGAAG